VTTGGAHTFQTAGGTVLAQLDSSSGNSYRIGGMDDVWSGTARIAQKLVRLKAGNSNSSVTANHGIDHNKIIAWSCEIRDDTTNTHVAPGSYFAPWLFYAKIDSLTVTIVIPASPSGYSVANDSVFCVIKYRQ